MKADLCLWSDLKELWSDLKELWSDLKELWSDLKELWSDLKELWSDLREISVGAIQEQNNNYLHVQRAVFKQLQKTKLYNGQWQTTFTSHSTLVNSSTCTYLPKQQSCFSPYLFAGLIC